MNELLGSGNIGEDREKINENFEECAGHIADESIHVTTAKKETWDETGADLTAHMQDKTNPHDVTAEQVGAAPVSHTHTASQISYTPSTGMTATNVQGALDVLVSRSSVLQTQIDTLADDAEFSAVGSYGRVCQITAASKTVLHYKAGHANELRLGFVSITSLASGLTVLPAGTITTPPSTDTFFPLYGRSTASWSGSTYYPCTVVVKQDGGVEFWGSNSDLANITNFSASVTWLA